MNKKLSGSFALDEPLSNWKWKYELELTGNSPGLSHRKGFGSKAKVSESKKSSI